MSEIARWQWCTGYRAPDSGLWMVHLLHNYQRAGDRCTGSYHDPSAEFGYTYCPGTMVVPEEGVQAALYATYKMGGLAAVRHMVEQLSKPSSVQTADDVFGSAIRGRKP